MTDTIMEMVIHQLENSVNKLVSDTPRIMHTITDEPHKKRDLKTMRAFARVVYLTVSKNLVLVIMHAWLA